MQFDGPPPDGSKLLQLHMKCVYALLTELRGEAAPTCVALGVLTARLEHIAQPPCPMPPRHRVNCAMLPPSQRLAPPIGLAAGPIAPDNKVFYLLAAVSGTKSLDRVSACLIHSLMHDVALRRSDSPDSPHPFIPLHTCV